jgi:hypothetical protein
LIIFKISLKEGNSASYAFHWNTLSSKHARGKLIQEGRRYEIRK